MANSTSIITDLQTVISNGYSAATQANCIAAGGPIMDITGVTKLLLVKAEEMKIILNYILGGNQSGTGSSVLSGDSTNSGLLTNIANDLT